MTRAAARLAPLRRWLGAAGAPYLPGAGMDWAARAEREPAHGAAVALWRGVQVLRDRLLAAGRARPLARQDAALWREWQRAWRAIETDLAGPAAGDAAHLAALRLTLRREGLAPRPLAQALAVAAGAARTACGQTPLPTQVQAAVTLLRGEFAEMATGEGKTLAMGLAAAVAALAGTPVHLLTANDYLAARDEAFLRPLFARLGLSSGSITSATPGEARAELYGRDIVVSTAREIGFDLLRDHVRLRGERDPRRLRALALAAATAPGAAPVAAAPLLRGLCLALLDEADSLLLDEATVPLVLAQPGPPASAARLAAAWSLVQRLQAAAHYTLHPAARRAELSAEGWREVAAQAHGDALPRLADAVQTALVARHLLLRDRDYAVVSQAGAAAVVLLDEATGRPALGRRWPGELTSLVLIKEGLPPEPTPVTVAQIGYPRLFGRYLHLAGLSGTLLEASAQLRLLYGVRVRRIPTAQPSRLCWRGTTLLADAPAHAGAVVQAVQREAARGRPVLVGTDSVAAAAALCERLAAAGLAHQQVDGLQDAAEADCIARAGQAGSITVATNIAGRGTDIRLDAAAHAAGGLHVIVTQLHRSRRTQRQLVGRAARHGDPGSAEALLSLADRRLAEAVPAVLRGAAAALARGGRVPRALAAPLLALAQRRHESADALLRWQQARAEPLRDESLGFAGPAA